MALQRQELVVPLGVTMNEGVPRELLPVGQLRDIQNGRVRKSGKLEKRYGYELLAEGLGTDTDGSSITSPGQRLLRRDGELLLVDGSNELHSYSAAKDQWKPRALAPEILVTSRRTAGQNYYRGLIIHTVTARIGNYLAVAWSDTLGTDQCVCRIYDETSGAMVLEFVDAGERRTPRLIAVGNYFVLAVTNGTVAPFSVRAFFLDTTDATWAWSSVTNLTTSAAVDTRFDAGWDIYPLDATNFVFANFSDGGGTLDLYRWSVDPFTLQDTEANIRAGKSITVGPMLYIDTVNTLVYVAYYNDTDNQVEVKGHSSATLSQTFAAQTIATPTSDPGQVTVGPSGSGTAWVCWQLTAAGTTLDMPGFGWRQINSVGTVHGTTHDQRLLWMASRPFVYGANAYICAITGYGNPAGGSMQHDQSAYVVVDLGNSAVANSGYRVRPVARFGEGEVGAVDPLAPLVTMVSASGVGHFAFAVRDPNAIWTLGAGVGATSVDTVRFQFPVANETDTHWSGWQEFGTNTFIPSGLAHHYDGDLVREFWLFYPWIDQISVLTATGTLTVGLLHEYCVVWVAMDNQGRVWRSRPSIIRSATPSGTDRAIRLRIANYTATSQETTFTFDKVGIEIYRRTVASDPFVRMFRSGIGPAEGNDKQATQWLQVDDTGASHSTANQPNLYTTGSVLEAFTPPPCTQSVIFDNRLWIFDRNVLWYTRELLDGEGPAFHPAQTITVGDEADITAIAVMDSSLVIFKAESILFLQGNGPDDTGANAAYSVPQKVMSPVGAAQFRSVVAGKDGLYFQSRRGIERLRRDMASEFIGERVEDSFDAHDLVTAAVHVQRDNEIRFSLGVSGRSPTTSTLVYDETSDVWSRDLFHGAAVTPPSSAVCVGGEYYWLEENTKRVYKETPGAYSDERLDNGIQPTWISLICETGDIIVGSPVGEVMWWRTMLFARRGDAHDLTIEFAMNNADSYTSKTWAAATIATWMQIPIEIPEVLPQQQRARSIRFRISDTTTGTPRQGPILYAIGLEYGSEGGLTRVPAGQRK